MAKITYAEHTKKRPRVEIDPKLIKRRSQSQHAQALAPEQHRPLGGRTQPIQTEQGFRYNGHTGKYETYREVLTPGAVGAKVCHPKKSRTYLILTGVGAIYVEPHEGERKYARLLPGDEVTVNPGDKYQLLTTSKFHLEYLVCQEAKYDANLETIEAARALEVPENLIQVTTEEQAEQLSEAAPRKIRTSKAAEQAWQHKAAIARRRGEEPPPFEPADGAATPSEDTVLGKQHGVPKGNLEGAHIGVNAKAPTLAELAADAGLSLEEFEAARAAGII